MYIIPIVIFAVTFYFIISGRIQRTIASLSGAIVMVVAGTLLGFYSQEEAFHSIDFDMIGLLAGMMVIVAVSKKSGIFSYVAIKAAKASGGSHVRLVIMMGCATAFLSMWLDNVTTIVLVIPITILICDILGISPLPTLMSEIVLSNIGGVGTMIGDPPNMMIATASGFTFNDFLVNLFPIAIVAMLIGIVTLIFVFRGEMGKKPKDFRPILAIDPRRAIRDSVGLKRSIFSLGIVFVLFALQEKIGFNHAFIALIGAGAVLILVRPDLDEIIKDVKWSVLIFFASLFVLIGGLEKTGILTVAAEHIVTLAKINFSLAKISLLWVSAIFASLVDRIPYTTAMIQIIKDVGALGVDIQSLWWVLALGVGFGGNGTPIGSLVGVVGLSMSEKTQSPIDFKIWLKTATLVMITTIIFASVLILLKVI